MGVEEEDEEEKSNRDEGRWPTYVVVGESDFTKAVEQTGYLLKRGIKCPSSVNEINSALLRERAIL